MSRFAAVATVDRSPHAPVGSGWSISDAVRESRRRIRRARLVLRRFRDDPWTLLDALGAQSRPFVCAACGQPLETKGGFVWSERFDGLVDPDCPSIPVVVRRQDDTVRLLWLRGRLETPATARAPRPFCPESAIRGL